ncbi:hypothetical protein [Powai lake megavirus]|uniref:Uncharacterized protein n=1 Tax=Powai lake megavirus TaxID=1842663 RepID=A0A167R735_9VIRU|nr:hypothetical protein QJ849_gp216 [Powai lake megavirus]ANB50378.1 hypothetical protein [Powai lake megavirus]
MCWSKEISLTTFIVAMIGVIYLYQRNKPNDRWIALFAGTIAMIQLAEYFMWSDPLCGKINRYASMFALFVLVMEPFMNMIGGIYLSDTPYKNILKCMLLLYIIFIGCAIYSNVNNNINWCGTSTCENAGTNNNGFIVSKSCNLQWFFMESFDAKTAIIWTIFLLIPLLTITPTYQAIIFLILGIGTYYMATFANNAAQGSLWCWLAIIFIFSKIFM